jgi:D-alanine-D-alanine ligase
MSAPLLLLYNQPVLPPDHPHANSEYDILDTVADAHTALRAAGFAVTKLGVNTDPQPLLDALAARPAAVFNLFEGIATQTGTEVSAAALLEWLNVPFTGCPAATLAVGRDKVWAKHLLAAAGVPTPEYAVVDSLSAPPWTGEWPAIAKPVYQDASVGIDQGSVVTSQSELAARVEYLFAQFGGPVLVERFIAGREFHVNLIEDRTGALTVLPASEVAFRPDAPGRWSVYTFTAKWDEKSDEFKGADIRTAVKLPAPEFAALERVAVRAYRTLRCRDYARIDVRVSADGTPFVLEMNPNPYLNSITLVDGLKANGKSYEWLVAEIAHAAIARGR